MEVGATVSLKGLKGIVRYVGEYHEKPGIYVGIELEKPKGKNNGTIKGKQYFTCEENHGLFIDIESAKKNFQVISSNDGNKAPPDSKVTKSPTQPNQESSKTSQTPNEKNTSTPQNVKNSSTSPNPNQNSQTPRRTVVVQNAAPKLPDNLKSPIPHFSSSTSNPNLNKASKTPDNASQNIKLQSSKNLNISKSGDLNIKHQNQELKSKALPTPNHAANIQARQGTIKPTPVKQLPQSSTPVQSKEYQERITTPTAQPKTDSTKPATKQIPSLNLKDKLAANDETNKSPRSATTTKQPAQQTKNSPRQTPAKPVQSSKESQETTPRNTNNTTPTRQNLKPTPQELQKASTALKKPNAQQSKPQETPNKITKILQDNKDQPNSARTIKQNNIVQQTPEKQQDSSDLTSPRIEPDSPRIIPDQTQLTNIDPQIHAKIDELRNRLEKCQKNRTVFKQKLIDVVNKFKQQREHQEQKKKEFEETLKSKLAETEVELETDLNDLESKILETAERTRHYLEMADEQRALKVIDLLEQINQEHELLERDIDLYVNTQRINLNQATQSVRILSDRLKKVLMKKQKNDIIIKNKTELMNEKEQELIDKRPRWKVVTELRQKFSELQEKVEHTKAVTMNKKAERTGIRKFYQIFSQVPLLDSLYLVLCIQQKTSNNDVRHACELTKLVLSGFLTNSSKCYELFTALSEIDQQIEKGGTPASVYSVIALLESMSSINLDPSISTFSIKSRAMRISNQKLKKILIDIANEIKGSPILHPALMDPSIREDFNDFVTNFKYEINKPDMGDDEDDINLDQFKGQLAKYNVPEVDVLKGFIQYQLPHDDVEKAKILPEIQKKRQERKELEDKANLLKDIVAKEKEKYEQLQSQLVEPLKIYVQLQETFAELKTELDKYQI